MIGMNAQTPDPSCLRADVVVVGGGMPGVCAAIAAARSGAETILVEQAGDVGGQAAEIDTWGMDGFVDVHGKPLILGLPWEILWRTVHEGESDPFWSRVNLDILFQQGIAPALADAGLEAFVPYIDTGSFMNPLNDQYINAVAYRYIANLMLQEAGVKVLLESPITDVVLEGDRVVGVVAQTVFSKLTIMAEVVVDTTQQAAVSGLCGQPFAHPLLYTGTLVDVAGVDIGQLLAYIRSSDEFWMIRPMAGKQADVDEMERLVKAGYPMAIHGFNRALETAVRNDSAYGGIKRPDKDGLHFFYKRDGHGSYWISGARNIDASDPLALSAEMLRMRRLQWLEHRLFRTYVPGFAHASLINTHPKISRAFMQSFEPSGLSMYTLTEREIRFGQTDRQDVLIRIRAHPRAANDTGWPIPLGALIHNRLKGLLITGKPACRMIHYVASCAYVGEAAGAAAAAAALTHTPLQELDAKKVVEAMRAYAKPSARLIE